MRKSLLAIVIILYGIWGDRIVSATQANAQTITILDREGKAITSITDGDSIRAQITLLQPTAQQETINFTLDNTSLPAGSCTIENAGTSCRTELFTSLGWYWDAGGSARNTRIIQAKNSSGDVLGQSGPVTVAPRPVVMVHGFISNWQTWTSYLGPEGYLATLGLQGFAIGDGQVAGILNTGVITNPPGRTNTLAQNAEILGEYISNVKKQTGAEMVDLVVHSMGGMISRYYIDRVMQERDVAQLIMLGSPMGGSDCAVLPAALGFYLPASIEIRESYMRGVFNQQITHRKGIQFYDLAGTAITEAFKSPCTDIPNDTVVSFGSVNAITLESSQLDDIHSDLTFSQKAFTDFVKPLLQKDAGSFASTSDPAPVSQADSPLQFTRVYTGHVEAGGSSELTINIESDIAVAAFALYDASRSVETVVRGASGNVIELDPQTNGFVKIDDPSSLLYLGYGFQNPRPGPWKVTVQATESTPASGTDFAVSVYFVGGARLEASSSTLVPKLNEAVTLQASVSLGGEPLQITKAQVLIKNPDGETETIDFPQGHTVSTTWTPRDAGTHAVDVVVTALSPDGTIIERTDFLAIEVQPAFTKGQITLNLVLLIVVIVLVLVAILFGIVRLFRRARR